MSRTQASSVGDGEDQEDFLSDLSLHSDPLTPEVLPCTAANAVEVHRDSEPGEETCCWDSWSRNMSQICKMNLYLDILTKQT